MSFVPPIISRDWRLKLAAFGLAVFMWLWAIVGTRPGSTPRVLEVPVTVEVADTLWTATGPAAPASVEIFFEGSLAMERDLSRRGIGIAIPIERVTSEDTIIDLHRDWVVTEGRAPAIINDLVPSQVRVAFEPRVRKVVPIAIETVGELPADRALAQPLRLDPGVVAVTGPASHVEMLDSVSVVPIDLSRLRESGVIEVLLDTTGLGTMEFPAIPASVTVRLEEALTRFYPVVPVTVASLEDDGEASDLTVLPASVRVTVRGGRTLVSPESLINLKAEVPEDWIVSMEPGEMRVVPVRLTGIPALVAARAEPDSVQVRRRAEGEDPGGGQ